MADMKLYHWYSEALADYTDGDIVVMAPDVRKARQMVLAEVRRQYRGNDSYRDERLAAFSADIAKRPDVLKGDKAVRFMWGSS